MVDTLKCLPKCAASGISQKTEQPQNKSWIFNIEDISNSFASFRNIRMKSSSYRQRIKEPVRSLCLTVSVQYAQGETDDVRSNGPCRRKGTPRRRSSWWWAVISCLGATHTEREMGPSFRES